MPPHTDDLEYLNDDSAGSLQALFATLELGNQSNLIAALNLLGYDIKGQVVKHTRATTGKLLDTKIAADSEQTTEAADAHQKALQPEPGRAGSPEYMIGHRIAIVAFQAVMMRMKAHSNEFGRVKGQHKMDSGAIICAIFEAFLDYREGAHNGYFVNKFFSHLPSNLPNPSSPSPITDIVLPFTPEVVLYLADKASRIEMARKYLGDSRLFSKIRLLLRSRSVQIEMTVAALLYSKNDAIVKQIHILTADAIKHLNASSSAQGKSLDSCMIRLAVGLVADRKTNFPREFEEDGKIKSNLRVVFALTFEAFVAHDVKGSYFHRKLAAAFKHAATSKSAMAFKRVAASKRTTAQSNADSTRDESQNVDHESQPAKKRKKQASKKPVNNVLEQKQESAEHDTSEARGTHLADVDSDPESSLFIPQTGSPVPAWSENFFEEFGDALDKGQTEKYSVFSKGSESLFTPHPTASNVPAPQKQRSSALPKARSTVLPDQAAQAPNSGSNLRHQGSDLHAGHKQQSRSATSLTATPAKQQHQTKNSSTASKGSDHSPIRSRGKYGGKCRRKPCT